MNTHTLMVQKMRWGIQAICVAAIFLMCLNLQPTPSIFGKIFIENATHQLQQTLDEVKFSSNDASLLELKQQAQQVLDSLGGNLISQHADIPLHKGSVRQHLIHFREHQSLDLMQWVNTYGPSIDQSISHQRLMMVLNVVLIRLGQAEHLAQMILLTKDEHSAQRYMQNLKLALHRAIGNDHIADQNGAAFVQHIFTKIAHLKQAKALPLLNFAQPSDQVASE